MDNLAGRGGWGPRPAAIGVVGAGAVVMAVAFATLAGDVPGRILTGVAALGLLTFAAGSWRARPRLAISPDGLVSRGWLHTRTLRAADLESVRITEFRRLARRVRLLEIDTVDGALLVFSRWDLGTDPLEVLDALTAAGYTGRPGGPR